MNNDTLLQELKQDAARDRWQQLWQAHQNSIIGLLLAVLLGTGGYSYWQHAQQEKHMAMTTALYNAMGPQASTPPDQAAESLLAFAREHGTGDAVFMAKTQAAALLLRADKKAEAILQYEDALNMTGVDANLRATATLKYVQLALERLDGPRVEVLLKPYQADNSPYRFVAWELGALNAYRAGDNATVSAMLDKLKNDSNTPDTARTRAEDLRRVLVK